MGDRAGAGIDGVAQVREEADGGASVVADPTIMERLDRQRVEVVPALPTGPAHDHETGGLQHTEVLHDRAPVEPGQRRAQVARGAWAVAQRVEQLPPGAVGQRPEHGVLLRFVQLVGEGLDMRR